MHSCRSSFPATASTAVSAAARPLLGAVRAFRAVGSFRGSQRCPDSGGARRESGRHGVTCAAEVAVKQPAAARSYHTLTQDDSVDHEESIRGLSNLVSRLSAAPDWEVKVRPPVLAPTTRTGVGVARLHASLKEHCDVTDEVGLSAAGSAPERWSRPALCQRLQVRVMAWQAPLLCVAAQSFLHLTLCNRPQTSCSQAFLRSSQLVGGDHHRHACSRGVKPCARVTGRRPWCWTRRRACRRTTRAWSCACPRWARSTFCWCIRQVRPLQPRPTHACDTPRLISCVLQTSA